MTRPKKLLVLKSKAEHFWYSCRIIEEHTEKAIRSSGVDSGFITCDGQLSTEQIEKLRELDKLFELNFFFLADFLDFEKIVEQTSELKDARFLIPIYGNMTVQQKRWLALAPLLANKKTALLAASPRSEEQLKALTKGHNVLALPFPHELETPPKNKSDVITRFIYAGRITPQKNVLELMDAFLKALEFEPNMELHIAGSFHDRGYHLHGYQIPIEKFKEIFNQVLKQGDGKIVYHDFVDQKGLLDLYAQMDCFCSASTYHDEDYGVSAVQAALSGLKLILSDWGGHSGISHEADFIPVEVDHLLVPRIKQSALAKSFIKHAKGLGRSDLQSIKKNFSYIEYAKRLKQILIKDLKNFGGLSETFLDYSKKCERHYPFHHQEDAVAPSQELYFDIYNSYLGKN